MTGKERARLRAIANAYETILLVGKNGITPELTKQADDALEKREMIKGRVHETCAMSAREVCESLCGALRAEPVQVIGTRFVIYRKNPDPKKRTVFVNE